MTSKILMGDMPELMENILNNLSNEFYSLYSCALVSRHWCKMSIPILWQDPFSFEQRPLYISNYFSSLDEDEKFILKDCGINAEFPKTLFNYARFLKVLDQSRLEDKVKVWINLKLIKPKPYYDTLMSSVINLLFKLLIESGATLHKLDLYFSEFLEFKPEVFYSLGQNVQFFSRLQYLSLDVIPDFYIENATSLLRVLAKNATKISGLKIEFYSDYEPQFNTLFYAIIRIIKSQEQLRLFSLFGEEYPTEFYGIISALECQKNSLQEVIIESCGYSAEFEVLKNCKNLETLRIRYCNTKLLKLLDYKIDTLEIVDCAVDVQTIAFTLEKFGIFLQRLKFESANNEIWEDSLLLKTLKSFCPNITYLNIKYIEFSEQLLELIGNLQKLQFLSLWFFIDDIPEGELKIRVTQFAEILPLTLQYLDLYDNTWLELYMDIFLNHCKAPLKNLLIDRLDNEKNTRALIEFCIRSKTLNYVGVDKYLNLDNNNFRKEAEAYVTLVPYERIVVNC